MSDPREPGSVEPPDPQHETGRADPLTNALADALAPPEHQQRRSSERERERTRDRAKLPGQQIGGARVLARGALCRYPRCGGSRLFEGVFAIRDFCPTCGLPLQREEGGFLGAMTLNYLATGFAFIVLLVVWLVLDLPDVQVAALTIAGVVLVVVVPLLFFRPAKALWAAVDFLVYRSDRDYVESPEG